MSLTVLVAGTIQIFGLTPGEIARLLDRFSLPNPEYKSKVIFGGSSDLDVPKEISFARELGENGIELPRGGSWVLPLLRQKYQLDLIDARTTGWPIAVSGDDFKPWAHQSQGAEAITKHVQGTIVLPCGTGKSLLGIEAIRRIKRSTLVIVPTKDIMAQWMADVEGHLGITPGQYGDGKRDLQPITVAIANSVPLYQKETNRFGFVIHDECHRSCARRNQQIMAKMPARWRLGLTATKLREDGLAKLIDWTFGETLLERTIPQMAAEGLLSMPTVEQHETSFTFEYNGLPRYRLGALHEAIVADEQRNQLVLETVKRRLKNEQSSVLVLSNRKDHCKLLSEQLTTTGIGNAAVTSATARGKRRQAIANMRTGQLQVLIATSLADEGLDIRRLSAVVIAFPEKAEARTIQRMGRVMRPIEGKFPTLDEFVDTKVPTLLRRWKKRKAVYEKLGLIGDIK